jgi:hypothetical protein
MKRIILFSLFLGLLITGQTVFAQKKTTKKQASETKTTEKKETKTVSHKSTGVNKDGTPDMRLKANKEAKRDAERSAAVSAAAPSTTTTPVTTTKTQTTSRRTTTTTSAAPAANGDKVIGTDDKGRTIYEGKRGGHYYINKNGNKEYVKRT